ncbi:MAG TPA: patatin-like phospholipase family protein [Thermoleophilaceae bacterium]|nr:patatin-like phospholipase family protein [Thermoleophilaceae bacterium]
MALDAIDPFNVKRVLERVGRVRDEIASAADLGFLMNARRALFPLPLVDRAEPVPADVLPPFTGRPAPGLKDKRVAIVGSGGSGACVTLVGVARAFEEANVRPAAISACSGSAVWGAMWAAGMTADEMADFSLAWRPQDYLDIQWTRIPRFALSASRGFTGLAKGEALERLFDRRLWHMSAGETDVPIHTTVYNLDRGRLEQFGSETTPDLTLGELVRIAVALPVAVEAVRVEGDLYVDGGVIDAFPTEPLVEDGGFDHVFGLNVLLPPGLQGDAIDGVDARRMSLIDLSRRIAAGGHLELARRNLRRLGEAVTLIEPVEPGETRGAAFYDLFLDRRRWPELMRRGHEAALDALEPFRAKPRAAAGRPAGARSRA